MTFSQVGNSGADTYGITVDWTFSNGLDYFVWAVTYDRGTVTFGGLWVTVLGLVSGVNVVGVNSTQTTSVQAPLPGVSRSVSIAATGNVFTLSGKRVPASVLSNHTGAVNGAFVIGTPFGRALQAAGFGVTPKGLKLHA